MHFFFEITNRKDKGSHAAVVEDRKGERCSIPFREASVVTQRKQNQISAIEEGAVALLPLITYHHHVSPGQSDHRAIYENSTRASQKARKQAMCRLQA